MIHTLFSPGLKGSFFSAIAFSMLLVSCDQCNKPPVDDGDGPVTASFTHNLQPNCPLPCQVCFTNNSQNADSYSWDFGNGQTSSETSPCITYTTRGTYTVTLTATTATTSSTTSQTISIQDDAERYKLTIPSISSGIVEHLLQDGQTTYAMMNVDGYTKIRRFTSTEFSDNYFPGTIKVNDMVFDLDGHILCVGTGGTPEKVGLVKLIPPVLLNMDFQTIYSIGSTGAGYSVVPKNTAGLNDYIIGGRVDDGSYNQARLISVDQHGSLQFADPVDYCQSVKKIFRNADNGDWSYIAIGEWLDPSYQKLDYHIFNVNENGIDNFPTSSHPGINNAYNDYVSDAAQSSDRTTYAVVGTLDNKPSFLTIRYQNQGFSPPFIKQDFPSSVTSLKSVCPLANNQGFAVCGRINTGSGLFDAGIFVAKINALGEVVWLKTLDNYTYPGDIVATPDGGCIVGGQELCADFSCSHPVLYKLDSNGEYQ